LARDKKTFFPISSVEKSEKDKTINFWWKSNSFIQQKKEENGHIQCNQTGK